jgi:hypothetical protein
MAYFEEEFVLNNMEKLLAAKQAADNFGQLFFQLERVSNYAFGRDIAYTFRYCRECMQKTIDAGAVPELIQAISDRAETHGLNRRLIDLRKACENLGALLDRFAKFSSDDLKFEDIPQAERLGVAISNMIRELIMQAFPVPVGMRA